MRTARIALAALTISGSLVTTAQAATVKVDVRPGHCGSACSKYGGRAPDIHSLHVDAALGETNTTTIIQRADGWTITDSSSLLTAGDRCANVDEHTVNCEATSEVWVRAGDGNDAINAIVLPARTVGQFMYAPNGVYLDGGPGDDTLKGGDGPDVLDGGGGLDTLNGGAGSDLLDDVDGGTPDADRFDGGPGSDEVYYASRRAAIRVDLRRAAGQGALGEHDTFAAIEDVTGGRGGDRIVGSARANDLEGGGGHDVLLGSDGADELEGGRGRDRIIGGRGDDDVDGGDGRDRMNAGAGDDSVRSTDMIAERIACGAGRDTVGEYLEEETEYEDDPEYVIYGPDEADRLAADCERAHIDEDVDEHTVPVQPVVRTATSLLFANPCRGYCERGTLRIRAADRSVALVRFTRLRRQARVAVPLAALPTGRPVGVRWRLGDGFGFDSAAYRTVLR